MTEFVDSWLTARKRHRCGVCSRFIEPGGVWVQHAQPVNHTCHDSAP